MKKKLLACFLCAVMAVTMAVPAFAADDAGGIPPTWPDYGMANQYRNTTHCRLNVIYQRSKQNHKWYQCNSL